MLTYLFIDVSVVVVVSLLLRRFISWRGRRLYILCLMLGVLTMLFDNVMIMLGFFDYTHDKILGIYIFYAPIEDFFYPILAVLLVPALWKMFGARQREGR